MSENQEKSKSAIKREARKAEAKAAKRKVKVGSIIETLIGLIIAGVFIAAIVMGIYNSATTVSPKDDFSACLTEDGYVKGANLSSVKDLGLEGLTINRADIDYSDDKVQADIDSILNSAAYQDSDASLTVKDGDTVNIDYVGYIDDKAFEGGSSDGQGYDLVIGSGSFIDDFEQQLIGSHPGDQVEVNVTFPDDYTNDPSKAGQDARFDVTINSIRVVPELTDDFVKEHQADKGSTVEELRAYFKDQGTDENLTNYISNYINDNAKASVPGKYLKNVSETLYYAEDQNYQYMNSYYQYAYGYSPYSDFYSFVGKKAADYQKDLRKRAKDIAEANLTYEAIFKNKGLTISDENYAEAYDLCGGEGNTFGEPYVKQTALKNAVMEYLKGVVTVQ